MNNSALALFDSKWDGSGIARCRGAPECRIHWTACAPYHSLAASAYHLSSLSPAPHGVIT